MKNRLVIEAIFVVVAFLLGFVPEYIKAVHLDGELKTARQENAAAELRDLAGLAYLQVAQKNFGLAADTSGRFFNRLREFANQTTDAARRNDLQAIAALQGKVMPELARGDPAVQSDLADVAIKTRQATGAK